MKLLEKKDADAMGSPFLGSPLGFPSESKWVTKKLNIGGEVD